MAMVSVISNPPGSPLIRETLGLASRASSVTWYVSLANPNTRTMEGKNIHRYLRNNVFAHSTVTNDDDHHVS